MTQDDNKMTSNDHFCPAPFMLYYTRSLGQPKVCPMALKKDFLSVNGKSQYSNLTNFDEHWNSMEMRSIRLAMINNQPVRDCQVCREQEAAGMRPLKHFYKEEFSEKVFRRVKEASQHEGRVSQNPIHWDLSVGNTCNLACRICAPSNSSLYEAEIQANKNRAPFLVQNKLNPWLKEKNLYENEKTYFKDVLLESLEGIELLRVQGGGDLRWFLNFGRPFVK